MASKQYLDPEVAFDMSNARRWSTGTCYTREAESMPEQTVVREHFGTKRDKILGYLGYIVGPANVWRFPSLVLRHGGAAFILVYLVTVIFVAFPISVVELLYGQYSGKNNIRFWDINPAFRGVGFAMCLVTFVVLLNYHLFMAYCLFYAVQAMHHTRRPPWLYCRNEWTHCTHDDRETKDLPQCTDQSNFWDNCSCVYGVHLTSYNMCREQPVEYFYKTELLGVPMFEKEFPFGYPSWQLCLCLVVSWLLVAVVTFRGTQSICKALFLAVLFPFVGLIILFVKSASVDGAVSGLETLLCLENTCWENLGSMEVWKEALGQAFISLSVSTGTLHLIGSYRDFRSNPSRELVIVTVLDTVTSLLATLALFLALGRNLSLAERTSQKPHHADLSLLFIAFPISVTDAFPLAQLWSITFFFMMYFMSIDAVFGLFDTLITYLQDDFRFIRRYSRTSRALFGIFSYLLEVILTCPGGHSLAIEIDHFSITVCLPIIGLFEVIAIMWCYGFKRFITDMEYMLDVKIKFVRVLFFVFVCFLPATLFVFVVGILMNPAAHKKRHCSSGVITCNIIAAILCIIILFPIVIWFCLYTGKILRSKAKRQLPLRKLFARLMRPSHLWGPADGTQIHRNKDTVLADIFRSLRSQYSGLNVQRRGTFDESSRDFIKELEVFYGDCTANKIVNDRPGENVQTGLKIIVEEVEKSDEVPPEENRKDSGDA